jgi:aryl-alcohol dehydrogenase-like predicted oxidoreductase
MKKRELGHSGLWISEIGLGCMSLPPEKLAAKKIVDVAIGHGITYFDTADLYDKGENEIVVGFSLKENRKNIILATKVGNKWNENRTGWSWDSSKTYIVNQVKESLTRLQTDYIDLYQLHGGTMNDNLEEAIDAFDSLKKEGLIRAYGISSIRPNVVNRFLKNSHASSIMMQYSMLDRRPEEWFDFISKNNASVVTRGSLAKGLLTSEGLKRALEGEGYGTYSKSELIELLTELHNKTDNLLALAIAYVLQNKEVAGIVAGASSSQQIEKTINAYHHISKDNRIEQALPFLKHDVYKDHRI